MNAFQEDWQIPGHWFDYYECLGISENATQDEIKKAYRKLAKENHPDLYPGDKEKEEKFKKLNIAYEILSSEIKRKDYDYEYSKRKASAKANTSQSQSTNQNQSPNNKGNNSQKNATQNSPIDFDEIVNEFRRNPDNKRVFRNLKEVLEIIVTSFEDYAKSVDDIYQELFSCLFNKEINKEEYIASSIDLKSIIIEQIKNIREFESNNRSLFSINDDLNIYIKRIDSVISEYVRKRNVLSKKYFVIVNFSKNFYEDELKRFGENKYLFVRELKSRIEPIEKELDNLEDDVLNSRIDVSLFEIKLSELSVKFNEVREWVILVFNISTKDSNIDYIKDIILHHRLNDTSSYKKEILEKIQIQEIMVMADELINNTSLYKYENISELYKSIINKSITENDYINLKNKYNSFNLKLKNIDVNKHLGIINKLDIIKKLLERNYLKNYSWNDILNSIISYERKAKAMEREKIANRLLKEVDSIMEFVRSLVDTSLTFKDLLTSSQYNKIAFYENRCQEIKTEMEKFHGYEREKDNINSAIYGLKLDLDNLFGVFKYYKKFLTKMVSYEDYLSLCNSHTSKVKSLFLDLEKYYNILGRRSELTSEETLSFNSKINEISNIFEKNYNVYSKLDVLTFQAIREGRETFKLNEFIANIKYCFFTKRKPLPRGFDNFFYGLNLSSYNEYINLKSRVESWIENNNIESLKKKIVKDKIENMIKYFPEMLKKQIFIINLCSLNKTNFDLVKREKEKVVQFLEELNQLLLTHADVLTKEETEKYWESYQSFKYQCDNIMSSKIDVIKKLKMETLNLLKSTQVSKNKIMESDTVSDEDLREYIQSLFNYHMNVVTIKLIDNQNDTLLLEEKIKVYEMIMHEISMLRSKNSNTSELETKYSCELEEIQKKLFFEQNNGKPERYLEYLWKQTKLEKSLSDSSASEQVFLEYLEVVGSMAKEEYLSDNPMTDDEILNSIRDIEANLAYLVAKRKVIIDKHLKDNSFKAIMQEFESSINEYEEQLKILKL